MKRSIQFLIILLATIFIVFSCGNPSKQQTEKALPISDAQGEVLKAKIKEFFTNSPSPIEMITHIHNAHIDYMPEYLNSPILYDKYLTTNNVKSTNLGIYLADLGYTCLYYKPQDAINYLKTSKAIFNDLGILEAFDSSMIIRFERNLDNRDSLINIMREAIGNSNFYLAENERNDIAAMILTGTWIEGMYMATNSVKGKETKSVSQPVIWKIGEQKATLDSLIVIVENVNDKNFSQKMAAQLSDLRKEFDQVQISKKEPSDEMVDISTIDNVEEITELTVINDSKKVQISLDALTKITNQVEKIRQGIVH